MKGKKFAFVLALGVLLVLGWLFCLKKASGIEAVKAQDSLVEQAEQFIGKEEYVRGIPLLEEALNYETERKTDIQRMLLEAYQAYGDMDSYYALVKVMNTLGNAEPEYYLTVAKYYLEAGNTREALLVLREGLDAHPDEAMRELFEANRYDCTMRRLSYQICTPSTDTSRIPAFDGSKWDYVDEGGSVTLRVQSDFATPFNKDGIAAIKKDGKFCTILQNGDLYGIDETGIDELLGLTDHLMIAKKDGQYGYYDYDFVLVSEVHQYEDMCINSCGAAAVKRDGKWGMITDAGDLTIDYQYDEVAVNSSNSAFFNDRAMVKKADGWVLIDTEGNVLSQQSYADAKAPESDGYIAVADETGRWGYIDLNGNQVIDFQYRDAQSFSCGLAAVRTVNEWEYINSDNDKVFEASFLEAGSFFNGRAFVKDAEGLSILTLQYYDLSQ